MNFFRYSLGVLAASLILFAGCEEKPPLLPQPPDTPFDTSYVELSPPFGGFTEPQDILIGQDQLLYVADTRANRVVMLNRAGQELSARQMINPRSLGQDSRLDLLIGGEMVAGNGDTVGAIFRLDLVAASHHIDQAPIDTVWRELAKPQRRFAGITVLYDNNYLVVRSGPDNSSFIDPDGRVLFFDRSDNFITPLPSFSTRTGSGITDINKPTDIAAFPGVRDFVITQSSEGVAYGAIWMRYESTADFDGWLPRYDPARPEDRSIDFVRPNRFLQPEGVTIDPSRRDVFIADADLDSVFKFNSRGAFKQESFGSARTNGVMRRPTGLAYFERVLYVLDAEAGQILRFRLSSDVPR